MSFKVLKLEEELGLEVGYGNSGRSWGCWVAVMKGTTDGRFRSMRKLAMDLLEGGSKGKKEREDRRVRRFWLGYQGDWLLLPLSKPGQRRQMWFAPFGTRSMCRLQGTLQTWCCKDGSELRTETCNWLSMGRGGSATRECDVVSQWIHKVSRERSEPWTGNAYLEMLNL